MTKYQSTYKDELRLALLFIGDLARDDTHASAKAAGFLAGVRERLGYHVGLSTLRVTCGVCGRRVQTTANGTVGAHVPRDPAHAVDGRAGWYCRGVNQKPRLDAVTRSSPQDATPDPDSPAVRVGGDRR